MYPETDHTRLKRLDHGSSGSRRYTRIKGADCRGLGHGVICFRVGWVVFKRLDPGSSKLARDDTLYSLVDLFLEPFHHFTFSPFQLQISALFICVNLREPPFHLSTLPRFYHSTYIYGGCGSHSHHPLRRGSSWGQPYNL